MAGSKKRAISRNMGRDPDPGERKIIDQNKTKKTDPPIKNKYIGTVLVSLYL
jgi:hypothetical protein